MSSTIGERIREIRTLAKQTQYDFARQLCIDRGHISKIETDKAIPSDSLVKLISWEYDVNERWVLFGEGQIDKEHKSKQSSSLNRELLHSTIETIESSLDRDNMFLNSEKKSEIICLIYDYYSLQEWDSVSDKDGLQNMVSRYLSLAGGDPVSARNKNDKEKPQSIDIKGNGNIGNLDIGGNVGNGNKGNLSIGGNITVKAKSGKIHYLPPPGTIGANPHLKETIGTLFNKLGEEREKRFGKQAYPVMYNNFKREFGIKNNPWTIIWGWLEGCAPDIIDYLKEKYDNTIQGRIEKAAKRLGRLPSRPQLRKEERELLSHLGLSTDSMETKEMLFNSFQITSHKHLTHSQHWQFVVYLREVKDQIYGNS